MSAVGLGPRRARRGVALIAALWLVVAIAVVALQFSLAAKERRVIGINAADRGVAEGAALGALAALQAQLDYLLRAMPTNNAALASTRSGDPWLGADSIYSGVTYVDSMPVHVELLDLGRRLNLNDMTQTELTTFFGYMLNDYATADHLAVAVANWMNPNTDANQAADYLKQGLLALPADGPFRLVDELQFVEGMTPAIYANVAPYFTVYGTGLVNVNTAPVPVLRAIPGMTDQIISNILNQRSRGLRISSIAQVVPGYTPARGRGANAGLAAITGAQQQELGNALTVNTREILATITARASPDAEPVRVMALFTHTGTTTTVSWEQW